MFRSNLANLLSDATGHMAASASSGKWHAYCTGYGVDVYHYTTHMFTFLNDGTTVPVDPGNGSTSDRCGVRRITSGPQGGEFGIGYVELYTTPFPEVTKSPMGYITKVV